MTAPIAVKRKKARRATSPQTGARVAGTAERIVDIAEEVVGRVGVDQLRLAEIARRLKITVPAIYAHFPGGRSELIAAIELRALDKLATLFELQSNRSTHEQSLLKGIRDLVRLIALNPAYLRVFLLDFSYPGGLPEVTRKIGPPGQAEGVGALRPMFDRLTVLLSSVTRRSPSDLSSGLFFNCILGSICLNVLHPPFAGDRSSARQLDLEEETVNLAMCYLKRPMASP